MKSSAHSRRFPTPSSVWGATAAEAAAANGGDAATRLALRAEEQGGAPSVGRLTIAATVRSTTAA